MSECVCVCECVRKIKGGIQHNERELCVHIYYLLR